MNIYENNKQLLTAMGGDSVNLATDFEVRKAILYLLGGDSSNCNSIYEVDKQILNIYLEGGGGTGGGDCDLIPITITENGVYSRESGGYSEVTVNVEIPECPEIPLSAITINSNGTYIPEEGGYNEVIVDVAGCGGAGGGEKAKVLTLDIDDTCIVDGTWGAEGIDTSLMTSFSNLFYGCKTLTQVDVSGWNTSNVTTMSYMFYNCSSLTQLDVSGWNTSNVTSMRRMFYGCKTLTQVDVSGLNTSNVTDMENMFYNCNSLTQLDVSGWDTSNVTSMESVFSGCNSLTQLDVSNWNTSNVTNMRSVFSNCESLHQLDLTNWDASKVTSINTFCHLGTFNYNSQNVVGGLTYDEVVSNNICILNGLRVSADRIFGHEADSASYRALINGLADLTGSTTQNLSFYSLSRLTDEDIAIATAKNWTISIT